MPENWRGALSGCRAALAIGLFLFELYPTWLALTTLSIVYLIYAAYSLFAMWWERADDGRGDLLRLMLDLIILLVSAANPPDRAGWLVALLYGLLLIYALVIHQLREVILVATIGLLFSLIIHRDLVVPLGPIFAAAGAVALAAGYYRRILEKRLSHAMKQTVVYRAEAESARELERQRIAADFHDGPLQSFISFQMRLEIIRRLLDRNKEAAISDLVQLQEICRKQITDMRAFVRSMRMSQDGAAPTTSVRQIAEDFIKTSGIALTWNVGEAISGLEPEVSHEVLQIIREALHNAQKHSKAAKVALMVERKDSELAMQVEDDGTGFPFGGQYNLEELELMRMGPESIKRRVRTLNGEMSVESNPGRGSVLRIRVPL